MERIFVSAAAVDITPNQPVPLGGYENRTGPFRSVADPLEANILELEGRHGRLVIVTVDLLYPGQTLRAQLLRDLDLKEEELFLCASHTHYAPMTAPAMPLLGILDENYVRDLSERLSTVVESLGRARKPCICTYHEGVLNHSINRRLVCLRLNKSGLSRSVGMGPNPAGERDESVRILKFADENGAPVAIVWNYACHASDFFDRLQVSAAYPGRVRQRLRRDFGPIPVLFFQGFSGDVRPPFSGLSPTIRSLVARSLWGPQFRAPSKAEWQAWSNSLADSVAACLPSSARAVELHSPVTKRMEVAESEFMVGGSGTKSLFWHLVDCGGFQIAGINAEPAVRYRRLIRGNFDGVPFLTVGCLDQTHCYLPTDDMISEGGYEVQGFRRLFGINGSFREQIQNPVIQGLRRALA